MCQDGWRAWAGLSPRPLGGAVTSGHLTEDLPFWVKPHRNGALTESLPDVDPASLGWRLLAAQGGAGKPAAPDTDDLSRCSTPAFAGDIHPRHRRFHLREREA
jgi:hypothetical protein